MSDWNTNEYLKYEKQRTQPAIDLAKRVADEDVKTIVDIGCGPGNSTQVLKNIFPDADILGIDTSPNMIQKAKEAHPDIAFAIGDATALEGKYDLIFSNACLQWIADHDTLIPLLMDKLNDGGTLAVQVPMNFEEPLFKLIKEVAAEPEWGLANVKLQPNETLTPPEYYNILSGCSSSFDMWLTKYYHGLADHKALVGWVKGSRLRPYLDVLGEDKGAAFEEALIERAKALYPVMDSGEVVLGFRRFFFVAKK